MFSTKSTSAHRSNRFASRRVFESEDIQEVVDQACLQRDVSLNGRQRIIVFWSTSCWRTAACQPAMTVSGVIVATIGYEDDWLPEIPCTDASLSIAESPPAARVPRQIEERPLCTVDSSWSVPTEWRQTDSRATSGAMIQKKGPPLDHFLIRRSFLKPAARRRTSDGARSCR